MSRNNIATLGGRVSLVAIVGADAAAARLRQQLAAAGVAGDGLVRRCRTADDGKSAGG